MGRFVSILNRIVFILTICILIIVSAFIVPRLFGVKPFVVMSGSMEPTIPTGSLVFVNTKDVDVKTNDVITFSLSTGKKSVFVTHRVHVIDESGLIQTKGDNNKDPDGWLDPGAVMGTVVCHIPHLGIILDVLQEKGFVLIAIWIFAINLVCMVLQWFVTRKDAEA